MQSLRILNSYALDPSHPPVAAASVHRDGDLEQPAEAGVGAMVAESELSHDVSELLEVRLLRREHWVSLEEGDHPPEQVVAIPNDEHERTIVSAVRSDRTAAEPVADQLEHLSPVAVLADMELRNELIPDPAGRVALNRDRETSFSIDVTRDVAIQPFLLIVRTRHVVTIVNVRPDVDDE